MGGTFRPWGIRADILHRKTRGRNFLRLRDSA